ncbi:hypothetical protein [uncultured Kordia sp.]|uniref:hypothetical protein n=1 Tax=uncultured Kordia sp. TaxID=507699 RepID=UPI00261083A9|nr:hypothetical protein [uncultured Kordia sp.]
MKKKSFKSLALNKTQVSNFNALRGGQIPTYSRNCATVVVDVCLSQQTHCTQCDPHTIETVCDGKSNKPTGCWYSSDDTFNVC